jgi:hypothetical protein
MASIKGGCLCGSVRYSSEAEPVMTAVCHCKHCQRQSGSAFSPLVAVPRGSLDIDRTFLTVFNDIGESGLSVKRSFCSKCGSPITSDVEATPGLEWIKAGTLDDTTWLNPTVNIWCDSAQHWTPIAESAVRFARNPPSAQA